ncbi:hypothetical protein CLV62_11753 [Dysgonomonas alginatilytica]|uniref:Uncharacterized protein n=1 Tax=Dysgonomonas alginatilytica TaxID=1605892 RepID=A0A2V3PNS0_9BACT|nr:hypothetical protein [Dysgonomonas alginatilytica]PXV62837.1 hypothetical protein CLV62_11753 [Dysgonomonas alginatilytica]
MNSKKLILLFFCIHAINFTYAQKGVGIGTISPHPSAILQIESTDKGVLFPKISLASKTDITTVLNPTTGLLVYNTGNGGLDTPGYVYWNGAEWQKLTLSTVVNPSITGLLCNRADFTPSTFTAGVPYEGTMTIPYTGGNGGGYNTGTPIASTGNTGLTATLQRGELATGNGQLVFRITGTPSASSPTAAIFNINELNFNCSVSLTGKQIAVGEQISFIASLTQAQNITGVLLSNYYPTQLPTVDGLRMDLISNGTTYYYPRVYNESSEQKIVSFQTFSVVGLQNVTNLNRTIYTKSEVTATNWDYINATARTTNPVYPVAWSSTTSSTAITDLQVRVGPSEWRWYEMTWWAMEINTVKVIFMSLVRKS